jgi:hypothetical protein
MLPGGFSQMNQQRTEANTYAALMELETCMTDGPRFLKGWCDGDRFPDLPVRPYDDVFLFDTANLARMKTGSVHYIFDMVADVLFDDFNSAEFNRLKRSVSVNQAQHKIAPYCPPVPENYDKTEMHYSMAYSACGRSVIDVQLLQRHEGANFEGDEETSLLGALEDMPSDERKALFQKCLQLAMPWVDSDTENSWTVNQNQYVCLVGVRDAGSFVKRFGEEFLSSVPVRSGITPNKIRFCEVTNPDKLTCYVELSGIPLASLRSIKNWRNSYVKESRLLPLHIHKDSSIFGHLTGENFPL